MVALEEILDHDLPVGLDRVFSPLAKRQRVDVNAAGPEDCGQLAELGRERGRCGAGADEEEGAERLDAERSEGEIGLVESGLLLRARGGAEGPVEAPGPGVIVALERPAVATRLQHQLAAAVAADVRKGFQRPRLVADDDDRDLAHPDGQEVAGLGDLLDSAGIVPARREDALPLACEHFGVGVPLGGEGSPPVERLEQ